MEIKNDSVLNNILNSFELACSIHTTVHKTLLDLPQVLTKFPPENRALRKAISEQFLEMLIIERDETLESAISAYKHYKTSKLPHVSPDKEPG